VFFKISALFLMISASLGPSLAFAQEGTEGDLEEVIVTAQFRETELMKSSGSISVVQQETLFDRGAQHLEETLNVLPNVSFSSGASRARFIQVRGVGDLEQFVDPKYFPSVGVTIDDVDMNGLAAAAIMMDIQQIEVLRGPQGTRFGTNAGGPLTDNLQGRIAVRQNNSDGYIRNDYLGRDDTNQRDEFSLRGKLRWLGEGDTFAELTVFHVDIENGYDAFSLDNNRQTLSDETTVRLYRMNRVVMSNSPCPLPLKVTGRSTRPWRLKPSSAGQMQTRNTVMMRTGPTRIFVLALSSAIPMLILTHRIAAETISASTAIFFQSIPGNLTGWLVSTHNIVARILRDNTTVALSAITRRNVTQSMVRPTMIFPQTGA